MDSNAATPYDPADALLSPAAHADAERIATKDGLMVKAQVEQFVDAVSLWSDPIFPAFPVEFMTDRRLLLVCLRCPPEYQDILWGIPHGYALITMTAVVLEHEGWKVWQAEQETQS